MRFIPLIILLTLAACSSSPEKNSQSAYDIGVVKADWVHATDCVARYIDNNTNSGALNTGPQPLIVYHNVTQSADIVMRDLDTMNMLYKISLVQDGEHTRVTNIEVPHDSNVTTENLKRVIDKATAACP